MSVNRAEQWSDEEFAKVFDGLYAPLCRYLDYMLGPSGAAQEVAQEAFLRLFRAGRGRVAAGEERYWLFRVASNLALNELRRARTRRRLLALIPEAFRPAAPDPHALAERAELDARLLSALDDLKEHQRAALLLREQEGLTCGEVAAALGVSVGKVKVDLFRARAALRETLAADATVTPISPRRAGSKRGPR